MILLLLKKAASNNHLSHNNNKNSRTTWSWMLSSAVPVTARRRELRRNKHRVHRTSRNTIAHRRAPGQLHTWSLTTIRKQRKNHRNRTLFPHLWKRLFALNSQCGRSKALGRTLQPYNPQTSQQQHWQKQHQNVKQAKRKRLLLIPWVKRR